MAVNRFKEKLNTFRMLEQLYTPAEFNSLTYAVPSKHEWMDIRVGLRVWTDNQCVFAIKSAAIDSGGRADKSSRPIVKYVCMHACMREPGRNFTVA